MPLGCVVLGALVQLASAEVQIADFRLPAGDFENIQSIDPSFGPLPTRSVSGTGFSGVKVDMSGISQNPRFGTDEDDLMLKTFHGLTMVQQVSRFAAAPDSSVQRVGAVQWMIDLYDLDSSLTARGAVVEKLELRLVFGGSAEIKVDAYLSPGDRAGNLRPIDLLKVTPEECFHFIWMPAQSRSVGEVVRMRRALDPNRSDTLLLAGSGMVPAGTVAVDLTAAYEAGLREFAFILTSASYGKGRGVHIREGSGVFLTPGAAKP